MNTQDGALYEPIYIPLEGDAKQFTGAINEAERRIKGFSDATVTAGDKIDKVFNNITRQSISMSTALQAGTKREIGLIADLEEALKELKEAKRNAFTVEEIEKYNQKIQEAERDLKEYNDAGKQAIENNEQQEESVTSLTGSISKFILGATGAAAILGQLKKAWLDTSFGINAVNLGLAAYKQLMYDIVTGGEINIAKIKTAIDLQRELNDLRIKEYKESYESAKLNNEYEHLYTQSLDQTLERVDRIRLIDEALEAHNKKIDIEIGNIRENLSIVERQLANSPGSEKLKKEYSDLMVALENAEADRVKSSKRLISTRSGLVKEGIDEEKKWRDDLHNNLMKWVEEENKITEEQAKKLKELNNSISESRLDGKDRELKQLDNQYEAEMEQYKDNAEIQLKLTEEYALKRFDVEMKYLDKLKKENEKFAESIEKIDPGRGYSILNRSLKQSGVTPISPSSINQLITQDTDRTKEAISKKLIKNLEDEKKIRQEILDGAILFTSELVDQLNLTQESKEAFNQIMGIVLNLAQGNYFGAAFSILSKVVGTIATMRDLPQDPSWKKQLEAWDSLIERQERLISLSKDAGMTEKAYREKLALLQMQINTLEKYIAEQEVRRGQSTMSNTDPLEKEKQDLADLRYEYEITSRELTSLLRGGLEAADIAGMIAQGLEAGKTSIDDFAAYLTNTLRPVLLKLFTDKYLTPAVEKFFAPMFDQALADDGKIDDEETQGMIKWLSEFSDKMKPIYDSYMSIFDQTTSTANQLTGSIKGVTEETASALAGQITAIRISQAESTNIMRDQLLSLHEIAANTRYNRHLESIDHKLDALQSGSLRAQGLS